MKALLRKAWQEHGLFILILYLVGLALLAILWISARTSVSPRTAWAYRVQSFGAIAPLLSPRCKRMAPVSKIEISPSVSHGTRPKGRCTKC
jgi:hypothetical protein